MLGTNKYRILRTQTPQPEALNSFIKLQKTEKYPEEDLKTKKKNKKLQEFFKAYKESNKLEKKKISLNLERVELESPIPDFNLASESEDSGKDILVSSSDASTAEMQKVWDKADPELKFGPVIPLFLQYLKFLIIVTSLICLANIYSVRLGFRTFSIKNENEKKFENFPTKENFLGYSSFNFPISQNSIGFDSGLFNGEEKLKNPKIFFWVSILNFLTLLGIYGLQIGYYYRRRRLGKKINKFFNNKISNYSIFLKARVKNRKLNSVSSKERALRSLTAAFNKLANDGIVEKESLLCNLQTSISYLNYQILKNEEELDRLCRQKQFKEHELKQDKVIRVEIQRQLEEEDFEIKNIAKRKSALLIDKISLQKKLLSLECEANKSLLINPNDNNTTFKRLKKEASHCRKQLNLIPETENLIKDINRNLMIQEENLKKQVVKQGQIIKFKGEDCSLLQEEIEYFEKKNKSLIKKLIYRKTALKTCPESKSLIYVFFVLESMEDKMEILKLYKKLGNEAFLNLLKIDEGENSEEQLNIEILKLKPAPEPELLNWKNIAISKKRRARSKLKGYLLSILFNLIIFILQTLLILLTFNLSTSEKSVLHLLFGLFSIVRGFKIKKLDWWYVVFGSLIEMLNEAISKFYKLITKKELHFSIKKKQTSFASKIIIGRFFISEVSTFSLFILPRIFSGLKKMGGVDEMNQYLFTMLLINITAAPIFSYFRLDVISHNMHIFGLQKRFKMLKKPSKFFGNKEEALDRTLIQDEEKFGHKYRDILKTLCISCFYSWVLPIGPFLTLGTFLIQYWVDKKKMTKNIECANYKNRQISNVLSEYFNYIPLLFAAGNFLFPLVYLGSLNFFNILGFFLAIFVCFFVPMGRVARLIIFRKDKEKRDLDL